VRVLRPFHSGRSREILQAPKVYGFDTGFVCHYRGQEQLHDGDLGPLWEHLVLNELAARLQDEPVHYWRDKQKHEVDFVLAANPQAPTTLEAKWKASAFDPGNLLIFRKSYPEGRNFLVAQDVDQPYTRQYGAAKVRFIGLRHLPEAIGPECKKSKADH
jgi:predicted AAA+ superfamily ATPase